MATSDHAAQTTSADQELRGGVVPFTMVTDANAAAAFYKEALGAEEIMRAATDDGAKVMHCHLRINGGSFVINDAFPEHGHPYVPPQNFTLHLQVDDVDAWWNRATAAGMEIVMPLELQFWGDRYGILRDRFGNTWSMGAHAK